MRKKELELRTDQVAEKLKKSIRRVQAEIKQGHFPHARQCECKKTWYILESDLALMPADRRKKPKKLANII